MKTLLVCLLLTLPACAPPPPNLTPAANQAFVNMRIQKALDAIRDIAQDGNALTPPVFSTATTRTITLWHESAITIVKTLGTSWQATLSASLDAMLANLSASERATLTPYVTLAKTIISEVAP